MNVEKFLIILFVLITFLLISVGGVFAEDIKINESIMYTNPDDTLSSQAVLTEDSLYVEKQTISRFDLTDNLSESNNDSSVVSLSRDDDSLLSDYVVNSPIVNPDFEEGLNGWDSYGVSITNFALNAKSGARFVSLSNNAHISQNFNFDIIDSVSFWYMSNTKGSTIDVYVDDVFLGNYTIQKTGLGKKRWEEVKFDLSNFTGYHTLNITQFSGSGYLDNFVFGYNNVLANFTIESYEIFDGKISINFTDLSYGLISEYRWDFGDGNYSNNQNPAHIFKLNNYTITLTVSNGNVTGNYSFDLIVSLPTIERTSEGFSTIQEAIDNALDGDVIIINSCDYYESYFENLIIDKSLTLDFNNCTLVGDSVNPTIKIIGENTVILNNISFNNTSLKLENASNLIIRNLNEGNVTLDEGNFEFVDSNVSGVYLTINNANVNITSSEINSGGVIVNGGKTRIFNSSFTGCDVAITQTDGELELTSNIVYNNTIGVNIAGGISNLSFNALYYNNISLVYNSSSIRYENNWWGKNQPVYNYSYELVNCDVLQFGGVKSQMDVWLVLNIAQSDILDYDYWIAGVTYYNLTVDLTHNNLGEDTISQGCLKDFIITLSNYEEYKYDVMTQVYTEYPLIEHTLIIEVSNEYDIVNGLSDCIFSLGYLTNNLTELNLTVLGENYSVNILNNVNSPEITFITPFAIFDDNLTVEINCTGEDAVIFYTLDGTNPGYSPTRLIYTEPFVINESSIVHYTVIDKWGNFQKILADSLRNQAGGRDYILKVIKQDVFVELGTDLSYGNLYYTVDGNVCSQNNDFENCIHYTHPFIVREPTEIYICCQDICIEGNEYWIGGPIFMSCYSYEFSCHYLKNYTYNNSNSIWSKYQGDNHNTGVTNYTGPLTNQSSWINNALISSGSAVVDNNGHVYIGGSDGYLYCLNTQGLVIWRFGTTSRIICTPTIGPDGNIYFSNWMDSNFYCISPDGQLIWKYELGDYNTATSPVFGLDNRLYVITSNSLNSNVIIFKDGNLVDNHTIPFISGSNPAVSDEGLLYLVSTNHELVILNFDGSINQVHYIDDGAIITSKDQNTQISVSIDSEGTVYVLNHVRSFTLVQNGTIYIDSGGYYVKNWITYYYALNAYYPNGTFMWTRTGLNNYLSGTPTYYKGILYVTGNDNLFAFNASNGKTLWSKQISSSGSTLSSPLVSGDEILYVTSNNMVYAFNLSGELIWQYEMIGEYGNPIIYSSPTLTADKTLIVTTNQAIYAFRDVAADFTYYHVNGTETTIQFIDLSTNGTNRYFWLFGDNNTSSEQNPMHTYNQSGKYRVTLFVEHNGNVTLARNTTIEVVFHDITPPSNVNCYINDTLITGGIFNQTQHVTLNASDDYGDVIIYYTVDGSNPLNSSTRRVYDGLFEVEVNTVLKMVARDSAGNYGNVTTINFMITDVINVQDEVNSTLINEIQALLDNTETGGKILFDYGVLKGANFTINKPLNIISNNNTILIGNDNQPVFTFTENAKGSILNGFAIDNNGTGILIKDTSDVLIRNCFVNASGSIGINVINSGNITIKSTTVNDCDEGVVVNLSDSTLLDGIHVSDCYSDGIWICQSNNTCIVNSLVEGNGKDPYKLNNGDNDIAPDESGRLNFIVNIPPSQSRANNILIDDSSNTTIIKNTINGGFFGIHLYHTTDGVLIDNNTIYDGVGDAILLSNNYGNVNITHNLIDECYNGIDFMGYSQNVFIKENTIERLHGHENDLYVFSDATLIEQIAGYIYETHFPDDQFFRHHYNGIQISYPASNFHEGNVTIIDNVVIRLDHRAWEARKYQHYLEAGCAGYGYNLMDGSSSYNGGGGATHYTEGKVDLVVDRIGDATFRLRLINRLDDHYLSNIPSFDVTFRAGGFTQTVQFINDSAIASFDVAMALSDIEAIISNEIRKSAHFDMEITEGYNSTNKENDSGYEEGEAINNPDPVIPSFDDVINQYNDNPVYPQPEEPEPSGIGNGTGDGIGNGTGSGNSTGNSTGTGTGNGNSTGTGNATGDNTSDNGTGDGNSEITNPDDPGTTPGDNPVDDNSTVDNPETPENPVNETNNNTVDTPEIPEEPVENNTNNTVETPEIPEEPVEDNNNTVETPDVPDNPVNETNNNTVDIPEIPEEPVEENNNNSQVNQDVPVDSGDEPETPANSGDNTEVIENTEPVTPSDSGDTSEAIESSQEVTPVSPQDPAQELEVSEVSEDSSSSTSRGESSASSDSSVGPQGGSTESGGAGKAYEVSKVIDLEKSSWQIVGAVFLFAIIIILGYGYRWGKKDGDDF